MNASQKVYRILRDEFGLCPYEAERFVRSELTRSAYADSVLIQTNWPAVRPLTLMARLARHPGARAAMSAPLGDALKALGFGPAWSDAVDTVARESALYNEFDPAYTLVTCTLWGVDHMKAHERLKLVGYDGVV